MRTEELIKALSQEHHGVEMYSHLNRAFCKILYAPYICANGKTLFEAVFKVAQQLFIDPNCPQLVKEALEDYDLRSTRLQQ